MPGRYEKEAEAEIEGTFGQSSSRHWTRSQCDARTAIEYRALW